MTADGPPDLRAVALAVFAWAGGLGGFLVPVPVTVAVLAFGAGVLAVRRRRGRPVVAGLCWLVAAAAVAGSAVLRVESVARSPVAALARDGAYVSAVVEVDSDPLLRQGRHGSFTLTRVTVLEVTGRGRTQRVRAPVLVIGDRSWLAADLGSVVRLAGRTAPATSRDLAAVVSTARAPLRVEPCR